MGKDILDFHAIYWPAFLVVAGLPLALAPLRPRLVDVNGEKMSKSVGNVIEPDGLVDEYGCDPVRYFMVHEVSFGGDGDFSHTKMADCLNAKLANELGNLAYRTLSFSHKHCDAATPTPAALTADDHALLDASAALLPVREHIDAQSLHKVTQTISSRVVQMGNQYIDVQAPWSLRDRTERMATVLWVLLESMRFVGILYQPVVPSISAALLDQLGVPHDRRSFAALAPGNSFVGGSAAAHARHHHPALREGGGRGAAAAAAAEGEEEGEEGAEAALAGGGGAGGGGAPPQGGGGARQLRPEGRGRRRRAAPAKGGERRRRCPVFIQEAATKHVASFERGPHGPTPAPVLHL